MSNSKENNTFWGKIVSKVDWLLAILLLLLISWFLWALFLQKPDNDLAGEERLNQLQAKNKCLSQSSELSQRQKYHFNHYDFYFYQAGCAKIDFYLMRSISQTVDASQKELEKIGFGLTPTSQLAVQLLPNDKIQLFGRPGYSRAVFLGTGENKADDAWEWNTNYMLGLVFVSDNRPEYQHKQEAAVALAFYLSKKPYTGSDPKTNQLYNQLLRGSDNSYQEFRDSLNN